MYVGGAPQIGELLSEIGNEGVVEALAAAPDPRARKEYLHWDKLRRLDPPAGLTSEAWWLKLKLARASDWRELPLADREGKALGYTLPDRAQRSLHRIDQIGGGLAPSPIGTSSRGVRQRLYVAAQMEEAIRSSQLEGATTARGDAKELLRGGRPPRDRSERMILNNYRALQFMRERMGPTLTPDSILELHRIVMADRPTDPAIAGRLQQPGEERVRVFDRDGGGVVWDPPPADQLPERMRQLCEFANQGDDAEPFVHPILRAILLHFWLAYDHPFLDGNGRTARLLFFWAMHRRSYWLAEYLPISRHLRAAPAQYGRAFRETETDGGDVTYFLLHQLDVLERALADLDRDLEEAVAEHRHAKRLLSEVDGINGRQLVLLNHALKHRSHAYTFGGHAQSNKVTHETARSDLNGLAELGYLTRRRRGREYIFEPAPDLPKLLKESGR